MATYDTDGNGWVNVNDNVDHDDIQLYMEICGFNDDTNASPCELHDCFMLVENTYWRSTCE